MALPARPPAPEIEDSGGGIRAARRCHGTAPSAPGPNGAARRAFAGSGVFVGGLANRLLAATG